MALFAFLCTDKPESLAVRMANRDAHLAYVKREPGLKFGGPFLDAEGAMVGSMLVVELPDRAAAEAFAAADPYAKAGLFSKVDIHGWRATVGTAPA